MEMALITSHKRPTALRGAAIPVACRRRCFKSSPSPTCHPLPVHLRGPLVASVASILKTLRPNTPSLPPVTRYPLPHQCSLTKLPYCPPPSVTSTLARSPRSLTFLPPLLFSRSPPQLPLSQSLPPCLPSVPSLAASVNRSLAPPHCCEQLASATSLTRCRSFGAHYHHHPDEQQQQPLSP